MRKGEEEVREKGRKQLASLWKGREREKMEERENGREREWKRERKI